jgi:hypothetical protein
MGAVMRVNYTIRILLTEVNNLSRRRTVQAGDKVG